MDLIEFIEQTEKAHFRTNMDTGANMNALMIWNMVREYAGMDRLGHDDLSQKHADDRGISLEEQRADEAKMDEYDRYQRDVRILQGHGVPQEYWPTNPFADKD